ncbi:MAG: ATP-dependent Clp protease ATP-binding subunit ClpA [Oligoflexales bacterium]
MIQENLQKSLNLAYQKAQQKGHEFVTVEHILYGLLSNDDVCEVLQSCGAQLESLTEGLEDFFQNRIETEILPEGERPQPTLGFQRVLQTAAHHILAAGQSEIDAPSVLVALFDEKDSHAVFFLKQEEVHRLDLVEYISHHLKGSDAHLPSQDYRGSQDEEEAQKPSSILSEFTRDLCALADAGQIDPVIGREHEIKRMTHILTRRRKNNPLLVGEAGVGKTALAEGLAYCVRHENVPDVLKNLEIYALDLGSLLAGTKYRGDFEQRFKLLLGEFIDKPERILFIDEIHTLMGAGAVSGSPMDASNLLKPLLSRGAVRCVGSTTFKEYREHIESDHAMARRFQKIDIEEPSVAETIEILEGLKSRYEEYHQVAYGSDALKAAATLSDRYLRDRKLPDKAIDVLDEAGAAAQLDRKSSRGKVGVRAIRKVVAMMARIPVEQLQQQGDQKGLLNLKENLKNLVFGQDDAIAALQNALEISRVGLGSEEGLIGSFLFAGPTGVGKTEVAKKLAEVLGVQFQRFDMSEYMESHAVARLLGAPPGYVGHDAGGLLTNALQKSPHCVLLLDEIEKAHPDILNVLLQVMDHGTLTDATGRKSDFRNAILIMSSNVGAHEMSQNSIGFSDVLEMKSLSPEALKKAFTPEFRNRIDAIVAFHPLSPEVVVQVVQKGLSQIQEQLKDKRIQLHTTFEAVQWLAEEGYDPAFGARPIQRLLQKCVKQPIARMILNKEVHRGQTIEIGLQDRLLQITTVA